MITLISGTNRPGSNTLKVAKAYSAALTRLKVPHQIFSLEELPRDFAFSYMSDSMDFRKLLEKYILNVEKIIVVVPEYNGTFPGIFKLFLDGIRHGTLAGKKVALVGVASGRGGNIRGLDHLVGALHYLQVRVFHDLLPVSHVRELFNPQGELKDEATVKAIERQVEGFVKF